MRLAHGRRSKKPWPRGPRAPALEGMSAASYVLLEFPRSIDEMERAHAAYRTEGDGPGAVRTARTLGYLHGTTTGDWAIASGWIARAKTLLVDQPDSSERGWVALTEGMFEESPGDQGAALRTRVGRRSAPV